MDSSRFSTAAAALAAACVLASACERDGATSRAAADNLLIVSFDTTRADRLTPYGYEIPTSPRLAELASRGVVFERAFTHVPSTLPAHSSMMTGLLPPVHGVRCNGKFRLADSHTTLAEIASAAGFATGAVVGAFPIARRFGLAQGFDSYDDDFSDSAITARRRRGRMDTPGFWIGHDYLDFERGADEVTDAAMAWLDANATGGRRWFLFAHYFDPHWPYEPVAEFAERFDSPYDAEIAYADHHLGRLLDAVAALPGRTLVVFTADHGEGLGDHGERLHNRYLYNSTLHVPLVISLDGATVPGTRVPGTVGHVDLMPTALELLGLDVPAGGQGRSLVASMDGSATSPPPRQVYAETLVWSLERPMGIDVRALIDGDAKVIRTRIAAGPGRPGGAQISELYDLASDFGERADRSRFDRDLLARMAAALDDEERRLAGLAGEAETLELDEGARERLKALGYL